ncbi:phosphate ABC transporter substrate-binding protein [Deltaproteobacteria bacterium]|nr:phosphate ABC transporter substrate-binding protein [Deltaproteobacteria bacterium]
MNRFVLASLLVASACARPEAPKEGDAPVAGKPTVIQAKGSDTMVNLIQRLSEEYSKTNPAIIVAVTGGGSGTGVKALIDKTTDIATASRSMKPDEIEMAKKNGVDPVETTVAFDGLSIYVNKDNPIEKIDFDGLKCIFGSEGTCMHWKDVGVTLDCDGKGDDTIVKVGRQNNSGTYEYFKEHVLGKEGKFTTTMDQSGTQQVVDVVGTTKCAIGYGGMGYTSPTSRHVCLGKSPADACIEPNEANVLNGTYPFSRPLYVYTDGATTGATKAFIDWAKGPAAKAFVIESGFVPTPEANGLSPAAPAAVEMAPEAAPPAPTPAG